MMQKEFSLRWRAKGGFFPMTNITAVLEVKMEALPWNDFQSVQLLNHVWLFVTPWTAARQASLSITKSWSLPKLMSIESVMPSSHLILCHPLLLSPSIFPRVFSNELDFRLNFNRCPGPPPIPSQACLSLSPTIRGHSLVSLRHPAQQGLITPETGESHHQVHHFLRKVRENLDSA